MVAVMAPQPGAGDGPEGALPLREPSRTASRTWQAALVQAGQERCCALEAMYSAETKPAP